jgi:cystathionine beta-lyase
MASVTEAQLRRRRSSKWSEHPGDVLPAFVAEMDLPVVDAISSSLADMVARNDFGYRPAPHATRLPSLTAQWYARFGCSVDSAVVGVVPDVVIGSELVLETLCAPGDGIVISTPLYLPLRRMSGSGGRTTVDVPLRFDGMRYRLDLDGIDAALAGGARVVLLCQPHNPTGTVFTAEELAAIVEMVGRHEAWLVCDEVHGPLVLEAAHRSVLGEGLATDRTVVVTSSSKGWNTAGLKCAVTIAGSAELAARIAEELPRRRGGIGIMGVVSMEAALEHGEEWRLAACRYLLERREQLYARLEADLPLAVTRPPEASYLSWIDLRAYGFTEGSGPVATDWLLEHARVALSAGKSFGDAYEHTHVRLNFATTPELLDRIVDRLAEALTPRVA